MSRRQSKSKYYHNKRKPKQEVKQQQNSKLQRVIILSQDLMSNLIDLIEESEKDVAIKLAHEERNLFAKYIVDNWKDKDANSDEMFQVYLKAKEFAWVDTQETKIGETTTAIQGD